MRRLLRWMAVAVGAWVCGTIAGYAVSIPAFVLLPGGLFLGLAAAAVVAALAVIEILIGLWWGDWRGSGFSGVVAVMFPVLVGALALSRSGPSRLLSHPAVVHGGRISFALYLVHVPVFEVFWTLMAWSPSIAPGSGLGTFLVPHVLLSTVVLAHLAYRYVEEPARRAMRRHGPAMPRRRGVADDPGTVDLHGEVAVHGAVTEVPRPREREVGAPV